VTEYRLYGPRPNKNLISAHRSLVAAERAAQKIDSTVQFERVSEWTYFSRFDQRSKNGTFTIVVVPTGTRKALQLA